MFNESMQIEESSVEKNISKQNQNEQNRKDSENSKKEESSKDCVVEKNEKDKKRENSHRVAVDNLKKYGINPHADESKVYFNQNSKKLNHDQEGIGGYLPYYDTTHVLGLESNEEETIKVLMHEKIHQAICESQGTSRERKERNQARYVIQYYDDELKKLERRKEILTSEDDYYRIGVEASERLLDVLNNKIIKQKRLLDSYKKGCIKFPKKMSVERANRLLSDYEISNDNLIDEAFAEFFDSVTTNYNLETEKFDNVVNLKNKKHIKKIAKILFGEEMYDSEKNRLTYIALNELYRKLSSEISAEETLQVIMPFSKYILDENEIENIVSSNSTFAELMKIVENTEDKRDVARKWVRLKAIRDASHMFEEKKEDNTVSLTKDMINGVLKKFKK